MKNTVLKAFLITACLIMIIGLLCGCNEITPPSTDNNGGGQNSQSCNHQYGEWTTEDTDPKIKCEDRTYTAVCSLCQKTETRKGTYADHTITEVVIEPNCGENGYVKEKCTSCSYSFITDTLKATGEHTPGEKITIPSTCIEDGYIFSVCDTCGLAEIIDTLPKLDHKTSGELEYNDTHHFEKCTECNKEIDAQAHIFSEDNICTVCGFEKVAKDPLSGTYNITLWVSDQALASGYSVVDQIYEQIKDFEAKYPGIKINATVVGVPEWDSVSMILNDINSSPDIFCFSQDDLPLLVQANALAAPSQKIADSLRAANDETSISAASVNGTVYAYPMSSDNGLYMYYDKSVISNPDDLKKIVADCEAAGKNIFFELENGWYNYSFFKATGCHSVWTMDANGKFIGVDDTYNSPEGLIAMKGMQIVTSSPYYVNSSYDFTNAGIVVTGLWNDGMAREYLGDNYAVADLPSFTVDGKTYHLGSFSGHKMMGVKPQSDIKKGLVLSLLAQYLTDTECQLERYESFNWVPSNLAAQEDESVQSNPAVVALTKQNRYAVPQGMIHGSWWDISAVLGTEAKRATDDSQLQAALDAYSENLNLIINGDMALGQWSVIGGILGTVWDKDFLMTEVAQNTFESEPMVLNQYEELKCRFRQSWDINYGGDGIIGGINFVVEESGTYVVRLVLHDDNTATITLIPA